MILQREITFWTLLRLKGSKTRYTSIIFIVHLSWVLEVNTQFLVSVMPDLWSPELYRSLKDLLSLLHLLKLTSIQTFWKISSNYHLRQICCFPQIGRLPHTASLVRSLKSKSFWRNFVKSPISPNSPFSSNSPLSWYPPLLLAPSNLSLSGEISSIRQFRRFRQIRCFPDHPSFACSLKSKSFRRNFVKSPISPNSPFSSNSPLSWYPPLSPAPSNLSLSDEISSNRQFRQICRFRQIRRFPDTPLFRSLPQMSFLKSLSGEISSNRQFRQSYLFLPFRQNGWRNFVKFAIFVVGCISGHISNYSVYYGNN